MKISKKTYLAVIIALALTLAGARADVVLVSTSYNDEPRTGGSFSGVPYGADSNQPLPWYGSANTTFYGDASTAQAYDPDENAVLFQNTGAVALNLTAASIGAFNLFTLDSIGGPVVLNPGANIILAGVDGSDAGLSSATVAFTIDGINYSYSDAVTTDAPNGVLFGANPFIGGCESIPWTAINTVDAPEPTTCAMIVLGALTLAFAKRRRTA